MRKVAAGDTALSGTALQSTVPELVGRSDDILVLGGVMLRGDGRPMLVSRSRNMHVVHVCMGKATMALAASLRCVRAKPIFVGPMRAGRH